MAALDLPARPSPSAFELLITCNPPILESLLSQVPTETIFRLYQTSPFLRGFFSKSPTSWRYISCRSHQPTASTTVVPAHGSHPGQRPSSNYALDQILLNIINPFSTRLVSLELDNTAVSGATLTSTVLILRRDTLLHVSVRGCKNVSLKYHINPWLQMHALAQESPSTGGPPGFETLALKSLYTYRCRHHRRRPYLPSSLVRKESDSEPTHELVLTCHKLGIWTDTAWCTTPGVRCYRRRGYLRMRIPQDPREVWVVYDRLWRSRNWLGPLEQPKPGSNPVLRKRKRDCRSWEFDEEGFNGEAIGIGPKVKTTPAHLRRTHTQFVQDITCQNCSAEILERCEQCSVMMHCAGCRKTLCASCAFDRPYLRNKNAPEEDRNKFWWAPGCAVSPCSMLDQDLPPHGLPNVQHNTTTPPELKFRWCCTEPVFSGGGGITFGNSTSRDTDRIRAAPLLPGQGWEDAEFSLDQSDSANHENHAPDTYPGPGGRWSSIDNLFRAASALSPGEHPSISVPRVLCEECYNSEHWKLKCKACSTPLCLKHDIGDRVKARICGYKDLVLEKQEYKSRQKALKLLASLMRHRKERLSARKQVPVGKGVPSTELATAPPHKARPPVFADDRLPRTGLQPDINEAFVHEPSSTHAEISFLRTLRAPLPERELPHRPLSPASNSTGPLSRSTSPTPSTQSVPATPEPSMASGHPMRPEFESIPKWRGCQAFFCPAIRAPGDHRRRCTAAMRQCVECKVHVCGDCSDALEPPCPCKGCRAPQNDDALAISLSPNVQGTGGTSETPLFFCPNCRWDRMVSGKCKRRSEAFLSAQSLSQSLKKMRKRKERMRKPLEERRTSLDGSGALTATEEAIDGLVEFFTSLNTPIPAGSRPEEANAGQSPSPGTSNPTTNTNFNDIQELEDMGALARDLIRRIQRLRDQFRPGSLAALALPAIRVEGDDDAGSVALPHGHENAAELNGAGENGAVIVPDLQAGGEDQDDEDHLDGLESSQTE